MKYALAVAAGLGALNTFLISYPGNSIPQLIIIGVGATSAAVTAGVAVLLAKS